MAEFYQSRRYKNVTEILVEEELSRQLSRYSNEQKTSFNLIDVSAYALNRLPTLYATSQEGLYRQKQRGLQEYGQQIKAAVYQALKIVESKPLRVLTPLKPEEVMEAEIQMAKMTLMEIAESHTAKSDK